MEFTRWLVTCKGKKEERNPIDIYEECKQINDAFLSDDKCEKSIRATLRYIQGFVLKKWCS